MFICYKNKMKIIFASSNAHKISELKAIVSQHFTVLGLTEIGIHSEIPETGNTIKENSYLKAKYVSEFLKTQNQNSIVIADDSGLEVEALNGAPGVYSARYAGIPKDDIKNNLKLVNELKNSTNRKARFVTIITLIKNHEIFYFEGEIIGTIAFECRGESGFGYDPLFIPQGYRSTFAQLGTEIKNKISHRALAVNKLLQYLKNEQ
jgi:XTP/dITP diphosphohydrolase